MTKRLWGALYNASISLRTLRDATSSRGPVFRQPTLPHSLPSTKENWWGLKKMDSLWWMISLMRNHDLDQEQPNVSNLCCPSVSIPSESPLIATPRGKGLSQISVAGLQLWMGSTQFLIVFTPALEPWLMHNVWDLLFSQLSLPASMIIYQQRHPRAKTLFKANVLHTPYKEAGDVRKQRSIGTASQLYTVGLALVWCGKYNFRHFKHYICTSIRQKLQGRKVSGRL